MKRWHYYLVLTLIAGLFVMPQLVTHKLILGADALFHYNRFYETAEQIRTGTFSYFISIFGFQQSGRIVNAIYGPIFSYLQGVLVLIAGSWFKYQVISNFFVYLIAGCSLFKLLSYAKVRESTALWSAIMFMTTYSINYWVLNQGFTSWGTSLMPLCLLPIIDMKNQRFPILKVAVSIAVMTQIHMLTAVMVSLIYLPFFIDYGTRQASWSKTVKDFLKSLVLYAGLSSNVWLSFFLINSGDRLKMPFTNQQMSEKAIDLGGSYWLQYPKFLWLLLVASFLLCIFYWHRLERFTKQVVIISGLFFVLSTSIVPWNWLIAHHVPFVSLVQFPFRFFAPFTVLFFLFTALMFEHLPRKKGVLFLLGTISLISIGQNLQVLIQELQRWDNQSLAAKHVFVRVPEAQARTSFFAADLDLALRSVEKSSPDYLPIYHDNNENKYVSYEKQILAERKDFSKTVKHGRLQVSWTAQKPGTTQVPVIVYQNTRLYAGNQEIQPQALSDIGTPTIKQLAGKNTIQLRYVPPVYVAWLLFGCGIGWLLLFIWIGYRFFRK